MSDLVSLETLTTFLWLDGARAPGRQGRVLTALYTTRDFILLSPSHHPELLRCLEPPAPKVVLLGPQASAVNLYSARSGSTHLTSFLL